SDKEYKSLSLDELKQILNKKKQVIKDNYKELSEKEKIIRHIRKVDKLNEKIKKGVDIKKEWKSKKKNPTKNKKIKSFDDYFQECIKNKEIPKDTPPYFRKALERAIKEHNQGLVKEKSALDEFAKKHIINGESNVTPLLFFKNKSPIIKDFLRNNRNIKVKFVLVCMMEKKETNDKLVIEVQDKAYFHSNTYINLKSTDVKKLLNEVISEIIEKISIYELNGSGWYFKEVIHLEIHTVNFRPMKGSSYIPLPDWIMRKKAIVSIRNKDSKCFLWSVLRYLHPREKNDCRLTDLKQYEHELNIPKGFTFPVKIRDITKFETLNPDLPVVDKRIKPITYTKKEEDENIPKIFVEKLTEATQSIYNDFYRRPKPLILTKDEQKSFDKAMICHICNKDLFEDKVRDHCHFTGQYRGAAHNSCNLKCRKPLVLPVIFHNLQGYDAHLFIKQLATLPGELNCIPSTEEKYISFSKKIKVDEYRSKKNDEMVSLYFEIRFIDSFKFLQTSLANLVSNLQPDDFYNTKREFKKNVDLLTRKGVYPYDYVSSLEKLSETQLPPKEEFYSKLNDEDITEDDYQHASNVWDTFKCKSLRDYHDLYLKTDVLLLADVFENFRKTCLKHYKLDPAHYYTSPGLAWDACLKETGQELQLLNDYDMLMMIEKGIRGGITHISKRYAEANNKYMKSYNPDEESTFIQYLDANNLYGWAMSQSLPTHGFKWMRNLTKETLMEILEKVNHSMSNRGRKRYIFEVDLEYPSSLWEKHNDYPLAPEKMVVNGVKKLICHFKPRKNYLVHYRNLRQYLEMGMRITAVHRGISFYQSPWMEPYIRKNTELRKTAANSFEKDFFKLMNNSVFGKTIENIRKRQNIELVDNRKKAAKLTSRPNFDRATIFDKNLIAVHMKKTEIYFDKPVYVGQAILDLSKTLMFDFHYNYIRKKYKNKAELLFTDTDSLMYQIYTDDFYKDISHDIKNKFDTSDYPPNHPSGILTGVNKKVIGMFKDEVAGKQITCFVGLRPKLYSFRIEEDKEVRKCKGIKKNVVKKKLDFDDYVQCLFSGKKEMRKMNIIRTKCSNCENSISFTIDYGYKICDECGVANGHVLGFYDIKDCDRLYYRKKSVYQRKYHYEKKVNQVSKRINLNDEQKYELYSKLMEIDNNVME
ncbi:unnamed protein product, partial [Porites evermanni]